MRHLRTLALGAALLAVPALAQDKGGTTVITGKFGFVNTERILRDAVPAQRAQKKIEAEFQKRDQEIARLADQLKRMQDDRSEEHTSELQSPCNLVCRLLLEKKKRTNMTRIHAAS